MSPLPWKIILQWSETEGKYEAYVPSLVEYIQKFTPENSLVKYSTSPGVAVEEALQAAREVLQELKGLAILPPPADVYFEEKEFLLPPEQIEFLLNT